MFSIFGNKDKNNSQKDKANNNNNNNNKNKMQQDQSRNQMTSPRRKPLSQVFYQQKSAKLPHNFAQNIMQLQMQLQFQQSYNLDIVIKLNQLYRIAIEHYINEDPRKASHFQRKLTTLLTNPQTLELMDRKAFENKQKQLNNNNNINSNNMNNSNNSNNNNNLSDSNNQHLNPNPSSQFKSPPKVFSTLNSKVRKQITQFNNQSDILDQTKKYKEHIDLSKIIYQVNKKNLNQDYNQDQEVKNNEEQKDRLFWQEE